MKIENLTPEQQEKLRACKTTNQIVEFAASEGIELTDDQLESISGGWGSSDDAPAIDRWKCPNCGGHNTSVHSYGTEESNHTVCADCKYVWWWHEEYLSKNA